MTEISPQTRNRMLAVLFLGVLMGALDIAIVGPALPAIQRSFGVDDRAVAWVFTIFVLFNLVGTPLMAKLSDVYGRRTVYVVDVVLFAAGSLLVAASPNFAVLLAGRAMQALGAGGIFPVASAVIGDTFPPEKRGAALGMIGAVFGLAFLVGPILGGLLLVFGWPWLFLVNLPVAAGIIVAALRLLPSSRPATSPPFDWYGLVLLSVILASIAVGISQLDANNVWASLGRPTTGPLLAIALLLFPAFVMVERRAPDPIVRVGLFDARQVALAAAFSFGAGLGESGMVFLPALAVGNFAVSASTSSFLLLPVVLGIGLGSPLAGRLLDRLGSRVVVFAGLTLLTTGMLITGLGSGGLALFVLAGALMGFGLASLLGAPLRYILLNESGARERGSAQGVLTVSAGLGQLVGGALVGGLSASQGGGAAGIQLAFTVIGVMAAVLTVASLALKPRAAELAYAARSHA